MPPYFPLWFKDCPAAVFINQLIFPLGNDIDRWWCMQAFGNSSFKANRVCRMVSCFRGGSGNFCSMALLLVLLELSELLPFSIWNRNGGRWFSLLESQDTDFCFLEPYLLTRGCFQNFLFLHPFRESSADLIWKFLPYAIPAFLDFLTPHSPHLSRAFCQFIGYLSSLFSIWDQPPWNFAQLNEN